MGSRDEDETGTLAVARDVSEAESEQEAESGDIDSSCPSRI